MGFSFHARGNEALRLVQLGIRLRYRLLATALILPLLATFFFYIFLR
jgi:hypothetical protein